MQEDTNIELVNQTDTAAVSQTDYASNDNEYTIHLESSETGPSSSEVPDLSLVFSPPISSKEILMIMQSHVFEITKEPHLEDIHYRINSVMQDLKQLQNSQFDYSYTLEQFKDWMIKYVSQLSIIIKDIFMKLESQNKLTIAPSTTLSQQIQQSNFYLSTKNDGVNSLLSAVLNNLNYPMMTKSGNNNIQQCNV